MYVTASILGHTLKITVRLMFYDQKTCLYEKDVIEKDS